MGVWHIEIYAGVEIRLRTGQRQLYCRAPLNVHGDGDAQRSGTEMEKLKNKKKEGKQKAYSRFQFILGAAFGHGQAAFQRMDDCRLEILCSSVVQEGFVVGLAPG